MLCGKIFTAEKYFSLIGQEQAGYKLENYSFSASVSTYKAAYIAFVYGKRNLFEDCRSAEAL